MSRNAMRHRATPPLDESAWPLYVLICRDRNKAANKFKFITWLTGKTRPHSVRGQDIEVMKAAVLKEIQAEAGLTGMQLGGPPLGRAYVMSCARALGRK